MTTTPSQLKGITFASTNPNKFYEVESILATRGIRVEFARLDLLEIQSDSLEQIAIEKARSAYTLLQKPVIVEDDGLFVHALSGFPGQYSSYAFKTIGNPGILKLLEDKEDRSASFLSLVAYSDESNIHLFEGRIAGTISKKITQGGWGYDPIFMPEAAGMTFAELANVKNEYSHRKIALEKFAGWLAKDTI